jgi:tRNA threonylcarbamoyladenosine biosynthesis protein TsaE
MNVKEIKYQLDDPTEIIAYLTALAGRYKIFTFIGQLGAGKTTLIRLLLRHWGITGVITSPTFTYVNIYTDQKGNQVHHFDLYRIKTIDEFIEQGFNEYLYQPNSWTLIEWPEIIKPLLQEQVVQVTLHYKDEITRLASIETR